MVRLKDSLSDTNPLIQNNNNKRNVDPYKKDQAVYPHKKKKKKKTNPKTQTVYPDQDSNSL